MGVTNTRKTERMENRIMGEKRMSNTFFILSGMDSIIFFAPNRILTWLLSFMMTISEHQQALN